MKKTILILIVLSSLVFASNPSKNDTINYMKELVFSGTMWFNHPDSKMEISIKDNKVSLLQKNDYYEEYIFDLTNVDFSTQIVKADSGVYYYIIAKCKFNKKCAKHTTIIGHNKDIEYSSNFMLAGNNEDNTRQLKKSFDYLQGKKKLF
jgi:hypothetical protein